MVCWLHFNWILWSIYSSIYSKEYQQKWEHNKDSHWAWTYHSTALMFCSNWRKLLLLNHFDYFKKLMVTMLHCKIHVNDGFSILKVVILMSQTRNIESCQKKYKDVELLLGETVDTKRYWQQLTNLNHLPLEKRPTRGNTK